MAELFRYAAFISYSSADAGFAARLHRVLETYRIPRSLGPFDLNGGGRKNRVYPVFRDREELSAGDLGERIEAALRASGALIVVCSPSSATSPWVQKEIEYFASIGRRDRIFAIIPNTASLSDEAGADQTQRCFPPALRDIVAKGGKAFEPLAGDARKGKDGFRGAWLKIVAGLIGVTPGQLIDRDRKRARAQALQMSIAATAVLLAVVLSGSRMVSAQMAERSVNLAELARVASNSELYDRAARYARAGLEGSDLPLLGYNAAAAESELRRALTGPLRTIVSLRQGDDVGRSFSPDGREYLYTRDNDNTARVREVVSGREVFVLRGHTAPVYYASFNPDGSHIFTASRDGTARVWDAGTGREISSFTGYHGNVASVCFSPDGRRIVIVASDNEPPRIWDVASGRALATLRGHQSFEYGASVWSASFSADGTRVVTSSQDMTARVWEADTGRELVVLRVSPNGAIEDPLMRGIRAAFFSPNGARVLTLDGSFARVWDVATGRETAAFPARTPFDNRRAAAFSTDGARVFVVAQHQVIVWDVALGVEIAVLEGHEDWVNSVAISPDGARIVTASADDTARVWEVDPTRDVAADARQNPILANLVQSNHGAPMYWANVREIAVLRGHDGAVRNASFSTGGTEVLTVANDETARVWRNDNAPKALRLNDGPLNASFSRDGARVVTASEYNNSARVWAILSGRELLALSGHARAVLAASFNPDGTRIVTGSADNTGRVWDAASGRELFVLRGHTGPVFAASFSSDGTRILTVARDGTARVWESATGREIFVLNVPAIRASDGTRFLSEIHEALFTPDGAQILTASAAFSDQDRPVRAWSSATGVEMPALPPLHDFPQGNLSTASFSPDGTRLVAAGIAGPPRMWDVASGREVAVLRGHDDVEAQDQLLSGMSPPRHLRVLSASFSQDGTRIVTTSQDRTARIWDVATGRELAVLRGHELDVQSASFSWDGNQVVTTSDDGTVRAWPLPRSILATREELMRITCSGPLAHGGGRFTQVEFRETPLLNPLFDEDVCVPRPYWTALGRSLAASTGTQ